MTNARIKNNKIIIELPVGNLPKALEIAWHMGILKTRYRITNLVEFAKDFVTELNREDEEGTTPIHLLFDNAMKEAIEQGAFGIEEHEIQEQT